MDQFWSAGPRRAGERAIVIVGRLFRGRIEAPSGRGTPASAS